MCYGIIIHYGLYSYYGYDDIKSAKRRSTQNGAEWYYGRLINTNTFRPISGYKYTQKYHAENHNNVDYFDNLDKITDDENKIKEWVNIAKANSATYIILTSKHHDGVCLFDTVTTTRKSKMDICKVFSDECKKQNILFGFYYSWFEFDKPFTLSYFNDYCIPQLNELFSYEPNHMWFDGDWKITQKSIQEKIANIVDLMNSRQIVFNDRIGKNNINLAVYRVFSDRFIPDTSITNVIWQHINTIGYSWGYNKMQIETDYKTKEDICKLYKQISNLGGAFLINFGPDENADIIPEEVEAIQLLKIKN